MKKKILILILVIVFAAGLSACGNKVDNEIALTRLVAFEEGNYWKYNGYGNEFAGLERKVLYKEGNKVQIMDSNPGTTMAVIYEITDEKVSVIYSEAESYEEINILATEGNMDQPILMAPIKEGQTWASNGGTFTVISTMEKVETDVETFENCVKIKVEQSDNSSYSLIYYKPDLGMVKQEDINESENKDENYKVTKLLSEYQVKGFK